MCLSQGGNPRFMSYLPKSTGIKEGSVLSLAVSVEGGGGGGGSGGVGVAGLIMGGSKSTTDTPFHLLLCPTNKTVTKVKQSNCSNDSNTSGVELTLHQFDLISSRIDFNTLL